MLVTNFSSGELSRNMFGRIDLPQYHSGAARLENWDVIPTGGIKRRSGMARLKELEAQGRLIPFIVNRDLNFLLHLMPVGIQVYRAEKGELQLEGEPFTGIDGKNLYAADEIKEVQYAQNYDTMVIVHENHPPLEVKCIGKTLTISQLKMNFDVQIVSDAEITETEKRDYFIEDAQYKDNGWMVSDKNYPRTVSFFNGRLVFAGTKNTPQRVFASAIKENDKPYNFATKKIFLNPDEKFISIRGTIHGDSDMVSIKDKEAPLLFTEDIASYRVKSTFFAPGTTILEFFGDVIRLSEKSTLQPPLSNDELNAFDQWRDRAHVEINSCDDNNNWLQIGRGYVIYDGQRHYFNPIYYMKVGVTKVRIKADKIYEIYITLADAMKVINNEKDARKNITDIIFNECSRIAEADRKSGFATVVQDPLSPTDSYWGFLISKLCDQIINYWQYNIREKNFYGTPNEIYQKVIEYYNSGTDVYIPFFTRKIKKDEYPTPDCGFTDEVGSDYSDAVKWLAVNRGIIIGTEMGEWLTPPDVYAGNLRFVRLSGHGSDSMQGRVVGDAALFFQSGRKSITEYYPNDNDHFRANNMALLAQHVLHESPAKEFDFATAPYTRLFVVREDGVMVTLLYERMTGTFAWSRITTGEITIDILEKKPKRSIEGKILSVAVLPGNDGFDDVYLIAERNGKFFLERLKETGTVYLDSWREWKWETEEERARLLEAYEKHAVVYDKKANKWYRISEEFPLQYGVSGDELPPQSDDENPRYIGYQYLSTMHSMPVQANAKMKLTSISDLTFRFDDSYLPTIRDLLDGRIRGVGREEPYTGVIQEYYPGGADENMQFEIFHEKPNRCLILSIYGEAR